MSDELSNRRFRLKNSNVSKSKIWNSEKEARSRVIEKKPPMAVISSGTDMDAQGAIKWKLQEKY